ncbi:MAG: M15 family metallopeptidase [Ruminococcus sp.]|nr:M15 family metallopeptidase [Ruminococcus sp.]
MNKGEKRRNRRRYKIRYDRIITAVLLGAIIVVLVTSCVKGITGDDKEKEKPKNNTSEITVDNNTDSDQQPTQDAVQPTEATEPATEAEIDSFYTTEKHSQNEVHMGDLILINAKYEYTFPEGDLNLINVNDGRNSCYGVSDLVKRLDTNVVAQINNMMQAFIDENNRTDSYIYVVDCFRTYDEQVERHNNGNSSFEPGHTDYHSGRTFDLITINEESESARFEPVGDYVWFKDNAERFGFIVRFPEDKSESTGEKPRENTYRYVGVPHASYMNSHNLCLDEYIEELKSHTKDKPLEISDTNGNYSVYYVPAAESGDTDVPVPRAARYTVSGNNVDGFIVTVISGANTSGQTEE